MKDLIDGTLKSAFRAHNVNILRPNSLGWILKFKARISKLGTLLIIKVILGLEKLSSTV